MEKTCAINRRKQMLVS